MVDIAPIKSLDLSHNNIGDEGAKRLAEVIIGKRTLVSLRLNNNQISDRGVEQIASGLCSSKKQLQELYLHDNKLITDKSVGSLIKMLKENQSLKSLWLINCSLTNDGRKKLAGAVASKRNFHLNMEKCDS